MEAVVVAAEQPTEQEARSQYEIERGKPMPSKNHSKIQARLSQQLLNDYEDRYDVHSELSLEAPNPPAILDLSIFPAEVSNWHDDEMKVNDVPLTVIEILVPSRTDIGIMADSMAYFAAGIQSYWLVKPSFRMVVILQPNGDELVFHNDLLTDPTNGISVDLKKIFR